MAEGTSIAHPVRWREVIAAIRRSNGATVAVSEAEIAASHAALARAGFYVEPTCATTDAALARLVADGVITPDQTTVVLLTGTGLKATQQIGEHLGAL